MKKYAIGILCAVILGSCVGGGRDGRQTVVVSIAPIGWIASSLLDSTVAVSVLVPAGSSPETYEPTVRQVEQLTRASIYLSVGLLDFEHELQGRLSSVAPQLTCVSLADGMDIMEGECSHHQEDGVGHGHGVDPHVWLSPKMMRAMVAKVAELLASKKLNPRELIMSRADSLITLIDSLDGYISSRTASLKDRTFAIVHPSLSYFARDYGLRQIAVEIDGKDPSAMTIRGLVDTLRAHDIRQIFYSVQNSATSAEVIAAEIGGRLSEYDPLNGEWLQGMINITDEICD